VPAGQDHLAARGAAAYRLALALMRVAGWQGWQVGRGRRDRRGRRGRKGGRMECV
jgi:hypothetical protein